jgi:hypothetical protein
MTWLQSCQTQTPTIEEVERLIHKVSMEYYAEGRADGYAAGQFDAQWEVIKPIQERKPAVKVVKCQHEPGNLRTLTIPPKTQCKHCGEYY